MAKTALLVSNTFSKPQTNLFPSLNSLVSLDAIRLDHDKVRGRKKWLEEVSEACFGDARKKSTRAQESAYFESRTISPRRQRRSRSPRRNPSVFTRLRRERSRSPEWNTRARK
ncbi:hypothetical protein Tco_0965656 [Tanacetum coccineum]